MKTYDTINELLKDLNITKPSIHPELHIFRFNETNDIAKEALEPHRKRFFTIDFYAENKSERQIGYTAIKDLNNSISFNSPLQLFSVKQFEGKVGSTGFSFIFSSQFFKPVKHQFQIQQEFPFFKLNSNPTYKLNIKEEEYIKNLLETIYSEYVNNESHSVEIIRSYLLVLLNYIKRINKNSSSIVKLKRYEELTGNFEELILEEKDSYKTIAEYAAQLNVTPIYLSECIKKATGLSAKKVLTNYKLLKTKSLLKQTNKSIEEIGFELGFDEATNFIKFFKSNQGITPASYRKLP